MKTKQLIKEVLEQWLEGKLSADVALLVINELVNRPKERPSLSDEAKNWAIERIKELTRQPNG